jgi:two-component system, OmpR family, response regulator
MWKSMDKARLLVVDDEPDIVELLSAALRYSDFEVETASGGRDAVAQTRRFRPDVMLLDVMMPDLDGFEVVRKIRSEGYQMPVIFLTARDAVVDRVQGLTLGADDYVVKPFSLDEVVARVHAVLRRCGDRVGNVGPSGRLVFADLELDEETHEVWKAGKPVTLSATEFRLLRYFMINQNRVLSKAQILDHVWNYSFNGEANVVESYVSYLRKKVETPDSRLIQTLRGVGYVLRMPSS